MRRARLGLLAIAALVTLTAVGSLIVVADLLPRPTVVDSSPSSVPSAGASPVPIGSPGTSAVAPVEWMVHDLGVAGGLRAIAAGGPGLVAVGYGTWAETSQVWTSTDGATWEMAPRQPSLARGAMLAVTDGPAGLVAVGRPCGEGYCEGAPIWTSRDGKAWIAVDAPRFSNWDLWSVVVFGGRYFAGGSIDSEAGVIASEDGAVWKVVWRDPSRSASEGASLAAGSASALTVFAGGLAAFADLDRTLRVSSDGVSWRSLGVPTDVASVVAMVPWRRGLVVVGADTDRRSVVWQVDEGLAWRRIADLGAEPTDLIDADGSLVVSAYAPDGRPSLRRSTDGETWETVSLPAEAGVRSILAAMVPFGDGIAGAGLTGGATVDQTRAAVWRGPLP